MLLELPPASAARRQLRFFLDNRDHLAPWLPPQPPGYYSEEFWRFRLSENRREYAADQSLRLSLLERAKPDGPVLGTVNFTQFCRGPFQSCVLGYSLAREREGQGFMQEALEAAIAYVFEQLNLHRVAANYMPENVRSAGLLRRLSFTPEGFARDYLFINGAWRDHILTAKYNASLLSPGVRAPAPSASDPPGHS